MTDLDIDDFEPDHEYTNEVVCPGCGYELGDSWELSGDDGADQCSECRITFTWERHVKVSYSTDFAQFEPNRWTHRRELDRRRFVEGRR